VWVVWSIQQDYREIRREERRRGNNRALSKQTMSSSGFNLTQGKLYRDRGREPE
jgi:hypothetical protein